MTSRQRRFAGGISNKKAESYYWRIQILGVQNSDHYCIFFRFVKQRGRVSIAELAENSNKLIALNTSWMFPGGIWNLTVQNTYFLKISLQMVQFSVGWALVPTIWKPCLLKSRCFCLYFKWSGFQIADPIEFWTIWKPTIPKAKGIQISDPHCIFYCFIMSILLRNISI